MTKRKLKQSDIEIENNNTQIEQFGDLNRDLSNLKSDLKVEIW